MNWKRLDYNPDIIYHYTKKENVKNILQDKKIKKFKDSYTFFTKSYDDAIYLINNVTCNPKCVTIGFDGIKRVNKNNPKDYVILKLEVDKNYIDRTKWFISSSASGINQERIQKINDSICYKGDLKFKSCEILNGEHDET